MYPNQSTGGILSLIKGLNISGILDGTQKTLGIINQAIPIVYQVKPLVNNIGTIFKISNILNEEKPNNNQEEKKESNNSPIFFV